MRARKKFGRCAVSGHSDCCVTKEIQHPGTRSLDKIELLEEMKIVEKEMEDTFMDEPV